MKPFSTLFLCASFSLAVLTMGCAEKHTGATPGTRPAVSSPSSPPSSPSSPSSKKTGTVSERKTDTNQVSIGTQGDTLEECLARIPSDASESQRMLATLTCERDARARASMDAVPGK